MPRPGGRPSRQYLEDTKRMQEKRKLREVGMNKGGLSPSKRFASKLKAIEETFDSQGKTPMKVQRMVDRIMARKKADYEKKKYLTGGQAKIAAKAPPTNKIDEKDFAVLRAEKAKDRGKGLQDEKVKPGKVMKAKRGQFSKSSTGTTAKSAMGKTFQGYSKVFKTGVSAGDKAKATSTIIGVKPKLPKPSKTSSLARRALKSVQATSLGKKLLPVVAAGVAAQQYLKSKMKKKEEPKKKMGGGMMKVPGYAIGSPRTAEQRRRARGPQQAKPKMGPSGRAGLGALGGTDNVKPKMKIVIVGGSKKSLTGQGGLERDAENKPYRYSYSTDPMLKDAKIIKVSRMGGGMMNKPMGYKSGKSIKVKCKLGKNKPTKMY